jgi:hypothetical protein
MIEFDTYVPQPLRSNGPELRIKGLAEGPTLDLPSSPPVNKTHEGKEEEQKETMQKSIVKGRVIRPKKAENEVQPTPARSGTSRYALRSRGPTQD